ncbi:MAG: hypothetical protein HY725_05010 [Candidatus Rokubacteria bacterium]|nr:hypothetical protein [Candidatus Rokubacteria bacterium]
MRVDRFGNKLAEGYAYAVGEILSKTADQIRKRERAWRIIGGIVKEKGVKGLYSFTGLDRGFHPEPEDLEYMDEEVAPGLFHDRFRELALDMMGGQSGAHDVGLFNRTGAASFAVALALLKPGDSVVALAPPPTGISHPTVVRAVAAVGGTMVNSATYEEFKAGLDSRPDAKLVTILRLRAESELIPLADLTRVIRLVKDRGLAIYLDDAAGARLCPVAYGQPKPLELGVDLAGTGMDKTGLRGPRFGILAGWKELVDQVKAKAFDHGLEARPAFLPGVVKSLESYSPERLRVLVDTTHALGREMRRVFGERVQFSPATVMLRDEEILRIALERSTTRAPAIVPLEASATLSMILLQEFGIVTVHATTGWPSFGGLLLKDLQPEVVERFGGSKAFVGALDAAFNTLAQIIGDPGEVRRVLFGSSS